MSDMASIVTIVAKADRRYRVRYRTPEGATRSKTFARKLDAENFRASLTVAVADGSFVDPREGRVTFGEYAAGWLAAQPHRSTTAESVETILRVHILPTFGARRIGSVRTSEVQAWVAGLELAPSTTTVVYGKLAAIFRAAVEDRVIARSPCTRRVRLPRHHGAEVVPMTPVQVRAMVEAVPARWRAFVVLLAGAGLRPGEALGLTVDRVDFLRRTIRVDRQLVTVSGQPPHLGPPKTPSSVRTIPVPQQVLDALAHHLERRTVPGGTVPERERAVSRISTDLLFTDAKGEPVRRNALGHMWRRAATRAGVEGFTPHDLRHYAASVLIDQGASVKAVQRHLGHASATTTLDVYAHLWPDSEDVTRRALDAGLAAVVSSVCHGDVAER
jgi:integrase